LDLAVTWRELSELRPLDRADAGGAHVHPFDDLSSTGPRAWRLAIGVAEALLVSGVEPLDGLGSGALVHGTGWQLDPHFPRLPEIPEVGAAPDADLVVGEAFRAQGRAGEHRQTSEMLLDAGMLEAIVALHERLDVVVLDVDHEQAERRDVAG